MYGGGHKPLAPYVLLNHANKSTMKKIQAFKLIHPECLECTSLFSQYVLQVIKQ